MKKLILIVGILMIIFLTGCGRGIVTPPVDNEIIYRALLVGIGDYIGEDKDLTSPDYSVDRMYQILSQCRFGPLNTKFSVINKLKDSDATKSGILDGIVSTFYGTDSNDISYFYYTGHGGWLGTSYLCPADYNFSILSIYSLINVNKLEKVLSAIPGTKVVILDTCHSGGFIGKGEGEIAISQEELESFNGEIINVFSQAESKGLLTTNQYKVLTSCHYYQSSWDIYPTVPGTFDPFAVFTMALCTGCGYFNYDYPADTNVDNKISLQEAYLYVRDWVIQNGYGFLQQDVQVYPDNSDFPIVEY